MSPWFTGVKKPALSSLTNKETNSLRMGSIARLAVTANKARKAFSKPTQLSVSGSAGAHLVVLCEVCCPVRLRATCSSRSCQGTEKEEPILSGSLLKK